MLQKASEILGRSAREESVASGIRLFASWLTSQMEYRRLPGVSVALLADREVVWAAGFGQADLDAGAAAGPETVYRIASITKLFTATAIVQLRERGLLSLDEPIQAYLPDYRLPDHPEADEPVTLRRILTHSAGLPREAAFPYWTREDCFPSMEEILGALPGQQPPFPPARKWKYSNLGMSLAGEVVARVSGRPFTDYLRSEILRPLGMRDTDFCLSDRLRGRLAAGYGREMPDGARERRPYVPIEGLDAAGGLHSTVMDLARFAAFQFHSRGVRAPSRRGQVLRPASLREMHRVHWLRPDWKGGWGLGFSIQHQDERDLTGHGGWLPGHQSAFAVSLGEGVAGVVAANADDAWPYAGHPQSLIDRLLRWTAPALARLRTRRAPIQADPGWSRYTGRYRSPWGDLEVMVHEHRLVAVKPTDLDPVPGMVELRPTGEHSFVSHSEGAFVEDGDPVRFELDARGIAVRLFWGENARERWD